MSPTPTEIAEAVERLTWKLKHPTPAHAFLADPDDVRQLLAAYTARGEALERAAVWFDEYAAHHAAKPDPEKEARNLARALICRLTLPCALKVTSKDPNQ